MQIILLLKVKSVSQTTLSIHSFLSALTARIVVQEFKLFPQTSGFSVSFKSCFGFLLEKWDIKAPVAVCWCFNQCFQCLNLGPSGLFT